MRIQSLAFEPLNIPLIEPFTIASGRLDVVENVLIRLTLDNGITGYGEAAPFEAISGETQATVLDALGSMEQLLRGREATAWLAMARDLDASFHSHASARAGLEMALLDALTRTLDIPLYQFFGGASHQVETDLTVPIVPPDRARELAREIGQRGIRVVKTKVGHDVEEDVARILAIRQGHPRCGLILDANGGFSPAEALHLLLELEQRDIHPLLLEQPVSADDWDGLAYVTAQSRVPVAADEAVWTAADAVHLVRLDAADVINVKIMKSGIAEALDIAAVARSANLGLMIGGMIESRLAMTCSAHLAAGLGCFDFIDLDTPMLLAEDPFEGGYDQKGAIYHLGQIERGIGVRPKG